ncbi:28145_t:CDS:1, partial [Racocetra persica]
MVWHSTKILQIGQTSLTVTVESLRLVYKFLIGELPQRWLSAMTLSTWYKEVSQNETEARIYKVSQCSR